MRIVVVNWSRRRVGGVETYLSSVIPELVSLGHEIGFWHEVDEPHNREQIALPSGVQTWSVAELGTDAALRVLRNWRPDIVYAHGLLDPKLEAETIGVAPSIFFAHSYYGTCISGAKTFKQPVVRPCDRRFGWQCLAHYYPHRCGGLNPVTMLTEYRRQAKRLELLHGYKAIVTHSGYIQSEMIKHGLSANSAYKFPYYVRGSGEMLDADEEVLLTEQNMRALPVIGQGGNDFSGRAPREECHLIFIGRMEALKGVGVLLDALPRVLQSLGKPLRVTLAGDGPARRSWERRAVRLQARHRGIRIEFTGWVDSARVESLLSNCDLLVLPSLWPEPFGLVGPEAGLRGVPIAAFSVGGIPDWLLDGVNGHLAPGDPPTAGGLAEAIVKCLADPATHARLSRGAVEVAQRFSLQNHLTALLEIFRDVLSDNYQPQAQRSI